MSEPTVRERIKVIASQMLRSKPAPATLREFEVALAGLLSVVNEECCDAEIEFRKAVLSADAESAAGKKLIAEASPSYARLLEAKATYDSCKQMLISCRSSNRSLAEEMRLQR